jgi:hypothetical protein
MPEDHIKRQVFVDFMYAIVAGSALPLINGDHLSWSDPVFLGTLFLILILLEDYFLYTTQIAPYQKAGIVNLLPLFCEIAILISWYLAVIASPKYPRFFFSSLLVFFVLKYLAGLAHWRAVRRWESARNLAFLIPAGALSILDLCTRPTTVDGHTIVRLTLAWAIMVGIWWSVTLSKRAQQEPPSV